MNRQTMDRFIFMCVIGFFISFNAVSVFAVNEALGSLMENEAYQKCLKNVSLTDAKFKEALDRLDSSTETTVPKDVLCLTKCITEETKILDSSGKIDVSVVKKNIPPAFQATLEEFTKCLEKIDKIATCEDMLKVLKCIPEDVN